MPPQTGKNKWRQTNGIWVRTLGDRGTRIRLFQRRRDGVFVRDVWRPDGSRSRVSLQTRDRDEAERLGKALLAELIRGGESPVQSKLTLGTLWEQYSVECAEFLDNTPQTRSATTFRATLLLGFFGCRCDVRTLSGRDIMGYVKKRRGGGLPYRWHFERDGRIVSKNRKTRPVRDDSVAKEIALLHAMLRWATTVRQVNGEPLLPYDPIAGVRVTFEINPRRSVATWERFTKTRAALQQQARDATTETDRRRYQYVELALILAEATGRRLNAIRNLRWEDINFTQQRIRWRADADKKRKTWEIPATPELLHTLKSFQREFGVVGGWLFPHPDDTTIPMSRYQFGISLERAEIKAELPKLDRALWHAYRRKWATERKHLPLKDVAAAGGWKDVETLLTCYQEPDPDTLLAVMAEPRKVREIATAIP